MPWTHRPGHRDTVTDRDCRRRLFEWYEQGLTVHLEHLPELIDQTKGVSADCIRELIGKAALISSEEGHESEAIVVEDRHIKEVMKELVFEGGELTKRLPGARGAF